MTGRNVDERGAALIFAIATVVVIGALSAALFTPLLSGARGRTILDSARDREYAADGAIQFAIANVRAMPAPTTFSGAGFDPCGSYSYSLNGDSMNVVCEPNATPAVNGFIQRDVVFTAYCVSAGCNASAPIIRAVVNFEAVGNGASYQVTHTYIRSWSVNG
jgi:hypothetical protein